MTDINPVYTDGNNEFYIDERIYREGQEQQRKNQFWRFQTNSKKLISNKKQNKQKKIITLTPEKKPKGE